MACPKVYSCLFTKRRDEVKRNQARGQWNPGTLFAIKGEQAITGSANASRLDIANRSLIFAERALQSKFTES